MLECDVHTAKKPRRLPTDFRTPRAAERSFIYLLTGTIETIINKNLSSVLPSVSAVAPKLLCRAPNVPTRESDRELRRFLYNPKRFFLFFFCFRQRPCTLADDDETGDPGDFVAQPRPGAQRSLPARRGGRLLPVGHRRIRFSRFREYNITQCMPASELLENDFFFFLRAFWGVLKEGDEEVVFLPVTLVFILRHLLKKKNVTPWFLSNSSYPCLYSSA